MKPVIKKDLKGIKITRSEHWFARIINWITRGKYDDELKNKKCNHPNSWD